MFFIINIAIKNKIEILERYRLEGNFPINYNFHNRIPVFIDEKNTLWIQSSEFKFKSFAVKTFSNLIVSIFKNISQSTLDGFKDFAIPFSITFDPAKMGESLLSTAMSAFSSGKLKLNFRGFVKVRGIEKKNGFKIPVIYGQTIKINK